MPLKPCPDCGLAVSPKARACPKCGREIIYWTPGRILLAIVVGIIVLNLAACVGLWAIGVF